MNEVTVVEADVRIREAAAQACSEHDEATYLMTHRTEISAIHEYNRTSLHSTIFQIFRENHVCCCGVSAEHFIDIYSSREATLSRSSSSLTSAWLQLRIKAHLFS